MTNAIEPRESRELTAEQPSLLGVIERIASNPDVDIERVQALLTMRAEEEERQRRIDREDRDEQAKREWLAGLSRVQARIGPILRGRENSHTRSRYADLADIDRVVTPILTEEGFCTSSVELPCETQGHIRMRLTMGHQGGHERHYEGDFPLDAAGSQGKMNKTAIQAKGSTQSYARRYLKCSALDLAFIDQDNDGNAYAPPRHVETITSGQVDELQALLDKLPETGPKSQAGFWTWAAEPPRRVRSLPDMPTSLHAKALKFLTLAAAEAAK